MSWLRNFLIAALLCSFANGAVAQKHITVFAAASLKDVLDDLSYRWRAKTSRGVRISYAGSALLAKQIASGAPADMFISANQEWMTWLRKTGVLAEKDAVALASNRLVLIGDSSAANLPGLDRPEALHARLSETRLAIALTDAVPAGQYAKEALINLGLWDRLAARLAQTDNVRAALSLVAQGQAPLGIVYASDAQADPRVKVISEIPKDTHAQILYPAALMQGAPTQAAEFLTFLTSCLAKDRFDAYGFKVLETC